MSISTCPPLSPVIYSPATPLDRRRRLGDQQAPSWTSRYLLYDWPSLQLDEPFRNSWAADSNMATSSGKGGHAGDADDMLLQMQQLQRRKAELSAWYLHHVEGAADTYLLAHYSGKYIPDAVPHDYLDTPPKNIDAVIRNEAILAGLLSDSRNKSSHVHLHLVAPTTDVVWDALDPFRASLREFLSRHDPNSQLNSSAASDTSAGLYRQPARYSAEAVKLLRFLRSDLEYLDAINAMEHSHLTPTMGSEGSGGGVGSEVKGPTTAGLDLVPISGMVLSKLHRLHNECKTVVGHWARNQ